MITSMYLTGAQIVAHDWDMAVPLSLSMFCVLTGLVFVLLEDSCLPRARHDVCHYLSAFYHWDRHWDG